MHSAFERSNPLVIEARCGDHGEMHFKVQGLRKPNAILSKTHQHKHRNGASELASFLGWLMNYMKLGSLVVSRL